ncbi:MAG: hypothetical protein QXS38_01035 [Candidatus Pacearchaeota archaeon]
MISNTGLRVMNHCLNGIKENFIKGLISRGVNILEAYRIGQKVEVFNSPKISYEDLWKRYGLAIRQGINPSSAATLAASGYDIEKLIENYNLAVKKGVDRELADELICAGNGFIDRQKELEELILHYHELIKAGKNKYTAAETIRKRINRTL